MKKNYYGILLCLFCLLMTGLPLNAQLAPQYPFSFFGNSMSSLVGAVNSYNNYLSSGDILTGALDGPVNGLAASLNQNQKI